jgi:hypothetical protein
VPVAVHGASSRIASNGSAGSQVSASAIQILASSLVRLRFSRSRSSRLSLLSSAVTCHPALASCSALPPGAAH